MFDKNTLQLMYALASQMQHATTSQRIKIDQNLFLKEQQLKEQCNNQLH
jgi:hypothetical protein